jgi:hypothetical protein
MNPMVGRFPVCVHGYMTPCPEGCGAAKVARPIAGLPSLPELTLDVIELHLKSLGLRSRISWRGGEWTVQLTSRKEEHHKGAAGRRVFGRSALIEEAFGKALENCEKGKDSDEH